MKRNSLQLDKNYKRKIYSNLINITYKNEDIQQKRYHLSNKKNTIKKGQKSIYKIFNKYDSNKNKKEQKKINNFYPTQSMNSENSKKIFNKLKSNEENLNQYKNFSNTNTNFNRKNYYLDYYQQTFTNRKRILSDPKILYQKNKPLIKNDFQNNLYLQYDREKILKVRNRVHKYLTEEFNKKLINNSIKNNYNDNNEEEIIRLDQINSLTRRKNDFDNVLNKNKRKSYLINKHISQDIEKRYKDLDKFLFFTDNISPQYSYKEIPNSSNKKVYNLNNFLIGNYSKNIHFDNNELIQNYENDEKKYKGF
jgi:hypothetical protein